MNAHPARRLLGYLREAYVVDTIQRAASGHILSTDTVTAALAELHRLAELWLDGYEGVLTERRNLAIALEPPPVTYELHDVTSPADPVPTYVVGQSVPADGPEHFRVTGRASVASIIAGLQQSDLAQAILTPDDPLVTDTRDLVRGYVRPAAHEHDDSGPITEYTSPESVWSAGPTESGDDQ